jgi:hypothetical protein
VLGLQACTIASILSSILDLADGWRVRFIL